MRNEPYKMTNKENLQAKEPVVVYRQAVSPRLQQRIAAIETDIDNGTDKGKSTAEMWKELKRDFPWLTD